MCGGDQKTEWGKERAKSVKGFFVCLFFFFFAKWQVTLFFMTVEQEDVSNEPLGGFYCYHQHRYIICTSRP